jgi:hypothetical protein
MLHGSRRVLLHDHVTKYLNDLTAATGQLRNAVVTDKSGTKHPVCMQMLSPLSVEGSDDLAGSGEGSSLLRCLLQKIEPHTEANLAVTPTATIVACSSATRTVFGYAPAELAGTC